jgi:hypothetical protein
MKPCRTLEHISKSHRRPQTAKASSGPGKAPGSEARVGSVRRPSLGLSAHLGTRRSLCEDCARSFQSAMLKRAVLIALLAPAALAAPSPIADSGAVKGSWVKSSKLNLAFFWYESAFSTSPKLNNVAASQESPTRKQESAPLILREEDKTRQMFLCAIEHG